MSALATAEDVIAFWFETCDRAQWFAVDPAFDQDIAARFGATVEAALCGELGAWSAAAESRLAAVLVLDQFTRNIFRGTPRAFAGDAQALSLALGAAEAGHLAPLTPEGRQFTLMPLMHSEDLSVQVEGLELFAAHCDAETLGYAKAHHAIIARFGRFPHRNEVLGRLSTPEETVFLQEPGSRF